MNEKVGQDVPVIGCAVLSCENIAEAFMSHLRRRGPLSIAAAAKRYWARHPPAGAGGIKRQKELAWKAVAWSALMYATAGVIEPADRRACGMREWLERTTTIREDEVEFVLSGISAKDFNRILILFHHQLKAGTGRGIDAIAWRLTKSTRERGYLALPLEHVRI